MRFHTLFNIQDKETGVTLRYSIDFNKILPNHAIGCTNEMNTPLPIIKQRPIFCRPPFY